jgi:hypothetical protein
MPVCSGPIMDEFLDLATQVGATFEEFRPADAGRLARDSLQKWKRSGTLEGLLDAISDEHYRAQTSRVSRQTDTHMKWFIYRASSGVEIWLHEFLPDDEIRRTDRYAASIHNHRYGFASVVLNGGYTSEHHRITSRDGTLHRGAPVGYEIVDEVTYCAGDAYFMPYGQFHRLRAFAPETCTLVLQLPPQSSSSFSVDLNSSTLREHIDVANDRDRMRRAYRRHRSSGD